MAHVLVRRLLGEYLDVAPSAVRITRQPCTGCGGPHGRPVVAGATGVHFSLSHAGDLVAVALAAVPVGVDVEQVPPPHVAGETAPTALHPGEPAELAALPEAARPAAFARCWTRKEEYLKGTGTAPATVRVGAGPQPARIPGWRVAGIPTLPRYAAAVATYEEREETDELHGEGPG